jgi:peroxiredoxin
MQEKKMSEEKSAFSPWIGVLVCAVLISFLIYWFLNREPAEPDMLAKQPPIAAPVAPPPVKPKSVPKPEPKQIAPEPAESEPADTPIIIPKRKSEPLNMIDVIMAGRNYWNPGYGNWYGRPAPDFTLKDLDGNEHKLSDYRGKQVMLVFWATWCGSCIMEMPHLIELHNELDPNEAVILAISYEEQGKIKGFVEGRGVNYTVLLEDGNMPQPFGVMRIYQTNGIPCSFFIDEAGNVKIAVNSMLTKGFMHAILQAEWPEK